MIYSQAPTPNASLYNYSQNKSAANSSADIYANQRLFQLMLTQQMNNVFSFDNNSNGNSQNQSYNPLGSSSDFGINDFLSSQINPATSQNQVVNYAHMIGKNVEGTDPNSGEMFSGKVKSVVTEDGVILLDLGEIMVSPEYVTKVSQ